MSKSFQQGKDLTGKRFGRLTVIEFVPNNKPRSYWKCQCDCGNISIVGMSDLKKGSTLSCGCLQREIVSKKLRKHGVSTTRIYQIWRLMIDRCYNPNNKNFNCYGGRGITVCDEWKNDVTAFYKWAMKNGYQDNLTLDRTDVNENYIGSNCRWVDMKTQNENRRNNVFVEYQGEMRILSDVARLLNIPIGTLGARYYRGDRGERLIRPVKK